jgi:uncharacterized protein
MKRLFIATWLLLVSWSPACAGWEEGQAAFAREDYATAFRGWLPLAKQGHDRAQALVGFMYFKGWGVPQDCGKAVTWLRQAAEEGADFAQSTLGYMYNEGQCIARDYGEALKWYRLAAEQGYGAAQTELGLMYEVGRGIPQHSVEAAKWLPRPPNRAKPKPRHSWA